MELGQIIFDVLAITFLGILVAFNPMLIAVDIVLVLRSKRPILNTAILIAGFVSSLTLLFIITNLLVDPDSQYSLSEIRSNLDLPPMIDILAGLLLLVWASRRLARPRQPQSVGIEKLKVPEKLYQLFGFAFVKAILSATNVFAILILAKIAVTNNWNMANSAMAVFWLLAVGVVPLLILAYFRQFKHESLMTIDTRLNSLLSRDMTRLLTYVIAGVGAFFLLNGIFGLLRN